MNITYVVNSNYKFYEKATKLMFSSLDKTNHEWRSKFVVIVGQSPIEETKIIDGVKHHFVKYGGIDFTAAFYIAEHQDEFEEYIFYTHDTAYMGENFFNLVDKNFKGIYYKRVRGRYGMNLGIFRKDIFERYYNILETLKFYDLSEYTIQYYKYLGILYEDLLCNLVDNDLEIFNYQVLSECFQYNHDEQFIIENTDIYQTGTLRNVIYVPELDYYKVKANIGRRSPLDWVTKL